MGGRGYMICEFYPDDSDVAIKDHIVPGHEEQWLLSLHGLGNGEVIISGPFGVYAPGRNEENDD